jgi:hypothetical protein
VFVDGPHAVTPTPLRAESNSRWRAPSSERAREARAAVGAEGLTYHAWWNDSCSGWKTSLDFLQTVLRQQVGQPITTCVNPTSTTVRCSPDMCRGSEHVPTVACTTASHWLQSRVSSSPATPRLSLDALSRAAGSNLRRRCRWLQGPFFGVIGFSQGATVGGLLCTNRMQEVLGFSPKVRPRVSPAWSHTCSAH